MILKKYSDYNPYSETALDYNLQTRALPKNSNNFNHYNYDMTKILPLSIYDNMNYRELDNNSKIHPHNPFYHKQ